jgi:hypothetical protein
VAPAARSCESLNGRDPGNPEHLPPQRRQARRGRAVSDTGQQARPAPDPRQHMNPTNVCRALALLGHVPLRHRSLAVGRPRNGGQERAPQILAEVAVNSSTTAFACGGATLIGAVICRRLLRSGVPAQLGTTASAVHSIPCPRHRASRNTDLENGFADTSAVSVSSSSVGSITYWLNRTMMLVRLDDAHIAGVDRISQPWSGVDTGEVGLPQNRPFQPCVT